MLLTQVELAALAGVSVRTIQMVESGVAGRRGHRAVTRAWILDALARAEAEGRGERAGVVHQLPPGARAFTGRDGELAGLDAWLAGGAAVRKARDTAPIAVISGTAGVGKTALAVRWARRNLDRFPDGQLFVDLRGFDPEPPVPAHRALAGFVRALGVDAEAIPATTSECAALFRVLVADRRILVVLDNALDAEQVVPLLPDTRSCAVLVTSRDRLDGLAKGGANHRVNLDPLSPFDAVALLSRLVGRRAVEDPAATRALADRCVRLPLALRVAAEYVLSRDESRLREIAAEFSEAGRPLDLLDAGGDERTALRAAFTCSYRRLPAAAALAFRGIGRHPGTRIDPASLAALIEVGPETAAALLETLRMANLVTPIEGGEYVMHRLLREYARERS